MDKMAEHIDQKSAEMAAKFSQKLHQLLELAKKKKRKAPSMKSPFNICFIFLNYYIYFFRRRSGT